MICAALLLYVFISFVPKRPIVRCANYRHVPHVASLLVAGTFLICLRYLSLRPQRAGPHASKIASVLSCPFRQARHGSCIYSIDICISDLDFLLTHLCQSKCCLCSFLCTRSEHPLVAPSLVQWHAWHSHHPIVDLPRAGPRLPTTIQQFRITLPAFSFVRCLVGVPHIS